MFTTQQKPSLRIKDDRAVIEGRRVYHREFLFIETRHNAPSSGVFCCVLAV